MKKTVSVKETAKLAGISVRTLHYYDEVGLLKPAYFMQNGYRQYDEANLKKLQQIMFYKELGFSLMQIKEITSSTDYDEGEALKKQRELLKMKRDRLSGLISLIDKTIGGQEMSFKEFDTKEIEKQRDKYANEANQRWGDTVAYKQSEAKTSKYTCGDWQSITVEADEIFKSFLECMKGKGNKTSDELSQEWQRHITKYYYGCSDEILMGLADMYAADHRFRKNIDKYGEGLSDFISSSIKEYLRKRH